MNKTFFMKNEAQKPQWKLIDAKGCVLGRLATEIASLLRGKNAAEYTPHADNRTYVVVVNSDAVELTGDKRTDKTYESYSGYMGGKKEKKAKNMSSILWIRKAVMGMLPKNTISRQFMKRLRIYKGAEHPHKAQIK
ncbi:MAG: 50S ribosomal protein L13 [Candidatus Babeliales bacterium]